MKPLYIFDLDGTLALIEHRRHLVEGETKDWRAFFAACVDDEPNTPVIDTLLRLLDTGCDVWVWSGRSSEVMKPTRDWLAEHLGDSAHGVPLCMRVEGDYTPDEQLKSAWLDAMKAYDRRRLVAVFDDRQKVVDMWRDRGVACFQVAPGGF
ncbi:MAG: hypothetical protein WBJ45_08100 [Limnohabitans sp.]|uniref:phosphatase domain-containing protein n=1 Tax=Limnohabitans sp. TaxID=1907725 RepID=UPI003BAE3CAD